MWKSNVHKSNPQPKTMHWPGNLGHDEHILLITSKMKWCALQQLKEPPLDIAFQKDKCTEKH